MMALVEPPIAISSIIAFSTASCVSTRRAVSPAFTISTTRRPLWRAARRRRAMTAGIVAVPGSIRPSASAIQPIVLAVPSIAQEPTHGSARFSMAANCASSISPRCFQPMDSVTMLPS